MIVPTSLDDMARRYELYDLEGNRILPQENALPRILDIPSSGQGCHGCDAYRPEPQVSGNLHVDPDTTLPTAAGPLELSWHYNASSRTNSPYGFARTVSINQTIQASGGIVTVTRGNSATVSYLFDSVSSSYKPSTPGLLYSLVADTTNNVWREYNLNGGETDFAPLNTTGQICSMVNYRDSCSNAITITYASGLPQNIEDPASRLVTLTFSGGLISSVEDWGARVTTFMFDTHSASPDNLLTTVIGPTGCTSVFGYATFALDTSIASAGFGWLLSEITDPNGYTTQYKYDRFTRVINRQIAGYPPTTYLFQPGAMITIDPLDRITTQLTGSNFAVMGTVDATGAVTTITRNANLQETSRQNMLGFISTTNYDGTGNISSRESPLGLITTYTRDVYNNVMSTETPDGAIVTNVWGYAGSSFDTTGAKRRLQAQINQMGEITSFAWTGQGLLQSETSPLGTIVTHNYDSNFNRVSTQDQLNNLWTNVFDLVGNITATENPLGARFSTVYDAQNRPTERISPTGAISTVGYDSVGNPTVSISPLGFRTTVTFNVFDEPVSVQNALNQVQTSLFDSVGRQIGAVSALGFINTIVLDNADRVIATVNPLGFRSSTLYDAISRPIATVSPVGEINTAIFDSGNRVIGRMNGAGAITSTIYDLVSRPIATMNPLGYLSSTVLDLVGRPIATVDAMGSRYTTTLDVGGRAIAQTDPLNRVNSTIFDAANRTIAQVDNLGYRVSAIFDNANRPIASQDQLGSLTSAIFDTADRQIATVDALSNRYSTLFDLADRPISSTDSLNRTSTTIFDSLNRAISQVSPLGFQTSVLFDADERRVATQDQLGRLFTSIFDSASRQVGTELPLGYRTTAIFDTASRQIATQNSLGFLSSTVYDLASRPVGFLDELSNRSTVVYDAASQTIARVDALNNRVSSTFDPSGRTIANQDARSFRTSMVFDVAGQNTAIVTANGGISSSLFDQRGYLKATLDALGALTTFTMDAAGNTVLRVDARNWPTTYSLDALNRPVGKVYVDGTRVTNTFDAASQQLTSQDVTGVTSYVWDLDSRKVVTVNPTGVILTATLDPAGNRLMLQDIGGATSYSWDSQDRLLSIVNPLNEITSIAWDALGREQHRILANGMAVSHTFDPAGRETLLENRDAAGTALAVFTNSYDAISNRLNVLELDGTRVSYAYDPSYQLINEQRSGVNAYNTSYLYDSMGNRLVKNDSGLLTTGTFNTANEIVLLQPPTGAPTTSTWDANGNLLVENTGGVLTTHSWDPENRLLSVTTVTLETYQYSQDDLRKKKTNPSGTTVFTWDEQNLLLETNTSNVVQARYTDYPGYWGGLASQSRSGTSSFFGFDSQGSTRILVSVAGIVTDNFSYKAFGEVLQAGTGTSCPFGYVGQFGYYFDALVRTYVRAREFKPTQGRWINRDPLAFDSGDWNLYGYVRNAPSTVHDPSGMKCQIIRSQAPTYPPCTTINTAPGGSRPDCGISNGDLLPRHGCTSCNHQGQAYTMLCQGAWSEQQWIVAKQCVAAAEQSNRGNMGKCCQANLLCHNAAGNDRRKVNTCNAAFSKWLDMSRAYLECRSATAAVNCFQAEIQKYCNHNPPPLCDFLRTQLSQQKEAQSKWCSASKNVKSVPACNIPTKNIKPSDM